MLKKRGESSESLTESESAFAVKVISFVLVVGIFVALVLLLADTTSNFYVTGAVTRTPECQDHLDNDADGYCDYPAAGTYCNDASVVGDNGCTSRNDPKE